MKITDKEIVESLQKGKRIKKHIGEYAILTEYDILCWLDNQGYTIYPVSFSDIISDDWEIVDNA